MQNIFVYGTLKRGHERQSALADQTFLKECKTKPLYWMYTLGSYPGLIEAESGQGDSVSGEVYRVGPGCRKLLDEIEAVDSGLYELREIQLEDADDISPVFAYFYMGSVEGCERTANW